MRKSAEEMIEPLMDLLVKEGVMSRVKKGNRWAYVQSQEQYDSFVERDAEISKKLKALEAKLS